MLISRVDLALSDSAHCCIARCADGTLGILIYLIQTTLVEGVFAEEVHCGKVQASTAGLAAAGLENDGLAS